MEGPEPSTSLDYSLQCLLGWVCSPKVRNPKQLQRVGQMMLIFLAEGTSQYFVPEFNLKAAVRRVAQSVAELDKGTCLYTIMI